MKRINTGKIQQMQKIIQMVEMEIGT